MLPAPARSLTASILSPSHEKQVSAEACGLIKSLTRIEARRRPTARQALQSEWLAAIATPPPGIGSNDRDRDVWDRLKSPFRSMACAKAKSEMS
jgi:hypothetical protein